VAPVAKRLVGRMPTTAQPRLGAFEYRITLIGDDSDVALNMEGSVGGR